MNPHCACVRSRSTRRPFLQPPGICDLSQEATGGEQDEAMHSCLYSAKPQVCLNPNSDWKKKKTCTEAPTWFKCPSCLGGSETAAMPTLPQALKLSFSPSGALGCELSFSIITYNAGLLSMRCTWKKQKSNRGQDPPREEAL